jgi:hypothetical protein
MLQFSSFSSLSLLGLNIFHSTPRSNTSAYSLPLLCETKFYTHVKWEAKLQFIAERYSVSHSLLPGISLIILTPMKILQWNLNRGTFVVWEMKRNVSVVCVCSVPNCCNILISGKIIKEMPGLVASGTHCITVTQIFCTVSWCLQICRF